LNLNTRQLAALENPCADPREWGRSECREMVMRGAVELVTFLAFDWFAESLPCWHVAIAIKRPDGASLKPVAAWDTNDRNTAMAVALETLGDAGDGKRGRWARMTTEGLDVYRAPTHEEREIAVGILQTKCRYPGEFPVPTELSKYVERRMDTDGSGSSATGTNGTGTPTTDRRIVKLWRVET